jgi:hypothetical protein
MLIPGLYVFLALFVVYIYGWLGTFEPPDPNRPGMMDTSSVPTSRPTFLVAVSILFAVALCIVVWTAMRGSLVDPHPSERAFAYGAIAGAALTALWIVTERAYLLWGALVASLLGVAGRLWLP